MNAKELKVLKTTLNKRELKKVTSLLAIYDKDIDNGVALMDDCSSTYEDLNSLVEALRDMFVDEINELTKKDLSKKFWINWIYDVSNACFKLGCHIRSKVLARITLNVCSEKDEDHIEIVSNSYDLAENEYTLRFQLSHNY